MISKIQISKKFLLKSSNSLMDRISIDHEMTIFNTIYYNSKGLLYYI